MFAILWAVLCCLFSVSIGNAASGVVTETVDYRGWKDAVRLSNGTVDIVVVPSIGRVMRYGFLGGPNLLFENDSLVGKPGDPRGWLQGVWTNFGGDKVWPWPQDDWGKRMAQDWPPPPAIDQSPYHVERIGPDAIRLTSSPVVGFGVRCVREIRLEPRGTRVVLVNRFEKISDGHAFPLAVWTITQIPDAPQVWVRLPHETPLAGGYRLLGDAPRSVQRTQDRLLRVTPDPDKASKIGCDGDVLATLSGDTLFTVRFLPSADNTGGRTEPGERAQVWHNPPDPRYIELELTGPQKTLRKGETISLTTRFEAIRLPENRRDEAAVAAAIRGQD
jgi:hypothetical protein